MRLKLPAGTVPSETEVLLDGVAVPPTIVDEDLAVEWPEETPPRPHVLELRYQLLQPTGGPGQIMLESPQIRGSSWIQRKYWQLALPRNEHVLAENGEWTGEYAWGWDGFGWGRVPLLDQLQLETWSGASHQTVLPEGTNQYVYSGVGPTSELTVWTAGRSLIVLVGVLAVLVMGLLLIYVARCRHPACFFAAAVVLAAFGLLLPEAAVLLRRPARSALLAVGAVLRARSMARRRPKSVVVRGVANSSVDRTLSHARIPRPVGLGSHSSTTTEPIGVPVPRRKPSHEDRAGRTRLPSDGDVARRSAVPRVAGNGEATANEDESSGIKFSRVFAPATRSRIGRGTVYLICRSGRPSSSGCCGPRRKLPPARRPRRPDWNEQPTRRRSRATI